MNRNIIIALASVLLAVAGYLLYPSGYDIKNVPPKNGTILIFGDSLAEGVGASAGGDLGSRLAVALGRPVLNYGVSGDTTRDALRRLPEALDEDAGTVIVILGGNDVLKKVPQEETFRNLETIVTRFVGQGAAVILVGVRSGLIGDGRGEEFEALAKKTKAAYVSDILQDTFADSRYMADPIHPNDAGYALIAARLVGAVQALAED